MMLCGYDDVVWTCSKCKQSFYAPYYKFDGLHGPAICENCLKQQETKSNAKRLYHAGRYMPMSSR